MPRILRYKEDFEVDGIAVGPAKTLEHVRPRNRVQVHSVGFCLPSFYTHTPHDFLTPGASDTATCTYAWNFQTLHLGFLLLCDDF
jgi:hypothetical protein